MSTAMENSISEAWKAAAADLGLHVTAPALLVVGDAVAEFDVLVESFGSRVGTAIVALGCATPAQREVTGARGVFLSELSPAAYGQYHRTLFIETLADWGWFGDDDRAPTWMKGVD